MVFDKERLENYNQDIREVMLKGYKTAFAYAFEHTLAYIEDDGFLKGKTEESIRNSRLYYGELPIAVRPDGPTTDIGLYNRRSFAALPLAKSKKVAILNFANAFSAGGAPERGSAQEESLCRASTLYPCLEAFRKDFYEKHIEESSSGRMGPFGTDDILYTPGVIQFKTDMSIPLLMEKGKWMEADIITCAAPDIRGKIVDMQDLIDALEHRIERIILVAKDNGIESIILGAWGCGVFKNPPRPIAESFKLALGKYHFDQAIFAVIDTSMNGVTHSAFEQAFDLELQA